MFFGRGVGSAHLFLQRADLGFDDVTATHLPIPSGTGFDYAAAFADVDLDGDLDLYLGRNAAVGPATDRLLLNRGDGSFVEPFPTRLPGTAQMTIDAEFADLDGDGDPDLVIGTQQAVFETRLRINHHIQVSARIPPTRGQDYEVRFDSQPGYANGFAVAVGALGTRGSPIALPPYGTWWLRPAPMIEFSPVYLAPSTGTALWVLRVPQTPALAGLELGVQSAIVHPLAPASLTNAWFDVVQ